MKKILIIILLLALGVAVFWFNNKDKKLEPATHLPWHVSTTASGDTHVLGVDIGNTTFKELMFKLQILAEPALFESSDGKLTLEAYFGKKKFGMLTARLVAEMDADKAILKTMLAEQVSRDSTPSNHWKYSLTIKNTKIANDLRVWRLVYLPITDYEPKQMSFFGEPEETLKINDTAEYRLYPSKGMVLLWDTAGKEVFYYVAKKDFARLKASLPMKVLILTQ